MIIFVNKYRCIFCFAKRSLFYRVYNPKTMHIDLKKSLMAVLAAVSGTSFAAAATQNSGPAPGSKPDRQSYTVIVDKEGVMRRSDTGAEVSYYGTNYTLPFAHAYRAMPLVGADRKKTIDLDVMHLKRLGFNGFRLHLWDAELADSLGNLLQNEHLDLFDYMVSRLEKEGIDIVITAQTNFGNGYPEKNIDTGSFTYDFPKCGIHEDSQAQAIQERYLRQLAEHRNPYTGMTYAEDHALIAVEINNEPCHSGTPAQVTSYINRMAKALRSGGFDRIILYNVSHNPDVTAAYYDADIQGTTYQWYPDGLVAGHERKGNLLPYVDSYPIPWSNTIPDYKKMARVIYEFDPGDVLCSYLYPAIVRTFRGQGFQWATQFAYDPTPIAAYNTEYQTHFLNLLYTPAKALSMAVASKAMRQIPRNQKYGSYPLDTAFGNFRVSAAEDLSLCLDRDTYIYSNDTDTPPADTSALTHVMGHGSSPIVSYPGSGAYFLDRVSEAPDIWRLEIMPDVAIYKDPFEKTSLKRPLASLYYARHKMTFDSAILPAEFAAVQITDGNGVTPGEKIIHADKQGILNVTPGVYILAPDKQTLGAFVTRANLGGYAEYCAPSAAILTANGQNPVPSVIHQPEAYIATDSPLTIRAKVFAAEKPRNVKIYPSNVSFWNEENPIISMSTEDGVNYTAQIPADMLADGFSYNIVVEASDGNHFTYPGRTEDTPLDWDAVTIDYYTSLPANPDAPFELYVPTERDNNLDVSLIPENWLNWKNWRMRVSDNAPKSANTLDITFTPDEDCTVAVREYIGSRACSPALGLAKKSSLEVVTTVELPAGSQIVLTGSNGFSYGAALDNTLASADGSFTYKINVKALYLVPTDIIPAPFPTFLPRQFTPDPQTAEPLDLNALDFVELRVPAHTGKTISVSLAGILLDK